MRAEDALESFVIESNAIEGINRMPTDTEIEAHVHFLKYPVSIATLQTFVDDVQPGAQLREKPGMNVRVGRYYPPKGGPAIRASLFDLLKVDMMPYERHCRYEALHPFMDGNGRSGRVLWLYNMGGIENVPLGFLHTFYYQALDASRR